MYNKHKQDNEKLLKRLIEKEGYSDIGWGNDGREFSRSDEDRTQPLQEIDCSLYSQRGTHKVYIDHDFREILHVDMSD